MYTLKELCDKAFTELIDSGLSYKTVYSANWYIWNRLVRKHGEDCIFEEQMVYDYCLEYFSRDIFTIDSSKLLKIEARYIIAFNNLINSSKNIPCPEFDLHHRRDFPLDDESEALLQEYIEASKAEGNSERTLANKEYRIRNFLIDSDFKNLDANKIKDYLAKRKSEMKGISYTIDMRMIRRFLVFAYSKGKLKKEILFAFPEKMPSYQDKNIPSAYSAEEIRDLLITAESFEREDNHLRNYAILCLIAYSGIRANDVVNLKLSNINWRSNQIRFIQQKTKREHIIPLIPAIGNPLANYIVNERNSASDYVFVTEDGRKLITQIITSIIQIYFSNSNIDLKGRHYGAHSLRHSIATNLINNSVSSFIVANVLGHSSVECVKIYAKVDIVHLKKCVLEAPYK